MYVVTWYEVVGRKEIEHETEFENQEEAESYYFSLLENDELAIICDTMEGEYDPQ